MCVWGVLNLHTSTTLPIMLTNGMFNQRLLIWKNGKGNDLRSMSEATFKVYVALIRGMMQDQNGDILFFHSVTLI